MTHNAETESPLGVSFPHYFSTYCMHRHHESCRRTCKTCEAECRCPCHWSNTSKYPEAEQFDGDGPRYGRGLQDRPEDLGEEI